MEEPLVESGHEDRLLLALTELRWRLDTAGCGIGEPMQRARAKKLIDAVVDSWATTSKDRALLTKRLRSYILPPS